ncbi:MAG: hypothetical protein IKO40_13660, partial [Kiritimatiellae bacterium]|nr:hypothetical protein [Kiritimatiellia bacterium]
KLRRFPIWFAEAKPQGLGAGAWGLHQCGGIKAVGSRSETAHQFPNFGAVAPSVPLCLCVRHLCHLAAFR